MLPGDVCGLMAHRSGQVLSSVRFERGRVEYGEGQRGARVQMSGFGREGCTQAMEQVATKRFVVLGLGLGQDEGRELGQLRGPT